ncbi:T9SS type A sorting domain-containing protein [Carboxylicivirga taeanensis]|uniref:T9SS type A sorting domain-containing protein n=1 Tax=Carboxylicivirga taeanensis TaxID=1416875 RepID=UPI003F6DCF0B
MNSNYTTKQFRKLLTLLVLVFFHGWISGIIAQKPAANCKECFSTELVTFNEFDNYLAIELKVEALNCTAALSHFTVEVPCGTVTEVNNSHNWPMEINSTDATTSIYGLKVDDIKNFGEDGENSTFTLQYHVYFETEECLNQLKYDTFKVAYKAANCIAIDSIQLSNEQLEASLTTVPITCYGSNNGQASVTVSNGTPPYRYSWSNGATTANIQNLAAGSYSVTITDATEATVSLEATITEPAPLSGTAQITNTECGQSLGAIQVTASGGTEPYSYEWSNGENTSSISQLGEGTYTLTLSDAAGCTQTVSYPITAKTDLKASISSHYLECYEEGNGALTVDVQGGLPPYAYTWNNGETTATVDNLNSGSYEVVITDANGCSITQRGYVILKKLNIIPTVEQPLCYGDQTGAISIDISNGTAPYDIQWSNGESGASIDGLAGDEWYSVSVTDAKGCTRSKYIQVTNPQQISINTQVSKQSCEESDSTLIVSIHPSGGTPPYDIYYNDELLPDEQLVVDKEGEYELTVIDANGCSITQKTLIERPEAVLTANIDVVQPNCNQPYGAVTITPSEGSDPYVAIWSDGYKGLQRTNLEPGEYIITIEDAIGCSLTQTVQIDAATQASVKIIAPVNAPLCNSADNVLQAVTEHAETYKWTIHTTNNWLILNQMADQLLYSSGEGSASITLEVTSKDGCTASNTITLSCSSEDSTDEDDTEGETPEVPSCENNCLDIAGMKIELTDDGCYKYTAEVITNGNCQYDLSHLTIHIDEGAVSEVSNSKNWPVEMNSTDPTTGLYGFKIDNIEGFGKHPESFSLEFKLCTETAPQSFLVAYKAGQCIMFDTLHINVQPKLASKSYPNPFVDQTTIEFTPTDDDYAVLNIYGVNGELLQCLYEGPVSAQTKYAFKFRSPVAGSNIYFYQLKCGNQSTSGKLIQTAY